MNSLRPITGFRASLLVGALVCAAVALAAPARAAAVSAKPIRFTRLSLEQGLSQSTVLCIFQDSRGFVWLCTEDGLNRFDGFEFKVFKHDPADPSSLPSSFVWGIDEDRDGNLWIGTDGGGLVKWDRATERFTRRSETTSAYIRAVRFDTDGALWIGTRDAGLDRLEVASGKVTHFGYDAANPSSLSNDHVYTLHLDRSGRLWVGTDAGVSLYEARLRSFTRFGHDSANPSSLGHDRVRALLSDESGMLWVGTLGGGLDRLDAKTGRSEDQARAALRANNPQGRFVQPAEAAAAVLWLCSAAAGSITGQAISVSGGETW